MASMKLTEKRIRDLEYDSGIHRDSEVKGFMVIAHQSTKTYAVQGDVRRNGRHIRTVRTKIDRVDRISLSDARRRARVLMSTIQSGVDPTAKTDETGITLVQALDAHLSERRLRERTVEDYHRHMDKSLKRFRSRAIADLTRADCRELYEHLKVKHGEVTAAGAFRVLRALINTAMRIDETILRNPVEAVRIPVTPKRKVQELDVADFWAQTNTLTCQLRDLQHTFLLTGARRASVLPVRREDVDLDRRILTFTHLKTNDEGLLFPMGPYLTEMLANRMAEDEPLNSEWLWPSSTSKSGYLHVPNKRGMPGPHTLRHQARTLMIAAGVPYAESAMLLGHRLPGAPGQYAHRAYLIEALRPHAEAYEKLILAQQCEIAETENA